MQVKLIAYSDREAKAFESNKEYDFTIERVAQMMRDLGYESEVLFTLMDEETDDDFSLSFGGTPFSLDFIDDNIIVSEFLPDKGDINDVEEFKRDQVNGAVLCLVNKIRESQANPAS